MPPHPSRRCFLHHTIIVCLLSVTVTLLLVNNVNSLPVSAASDVAGSTDDQQLPEFGFPQDDLHDRLDVYGVGGGGGGGDSRQARLDFVNLKEVRFQKAEALLKEMKAAEANRISRAGGNIDEKRRTW